MRPHNLAAVLVAFPLYLVSAQDKSASTSRPLGTEALAGIRTFFAYDTAVPLAVRVSTDEATTTYRRERIVFTGTNGNRVPGYLTLPLGVTGRVPLVVAIHAGASSKDAWWQIESFERGRLVTDRLLAANVAVLSLDAQFHGERSAGNDFESFRTMWFDGKKFTWVRDGIIQTVRDYRRALDYVATRPELDMSRVGVIGYSLGGMMSLYLTAFDTRPTATVACVAGVDEPWLYPIAPINLAANMGRIPLLLLAGRTDALATPAKMEALFAAIPTTQKRLRYFESGHRLPEAYADSATAWLITRLK
jgi:dienelactone hydrolase